MSILLTAVVLSYQSRVLLNFDSDRQPQKLVLIEYLLGFFCLWQNHHYQRHGLATIALQANYVKLSPVKRFKAYTGKAIPKSDQNFSRHMRYQGLPIKR
nr:unnamed protein product [Callosobruchus chinensis]